jgi:hypothetical protein
MSGMKFGFSDYEQTMTQKPPITSVEADRCGDTSERSSFSYGIAGNKKVGRSP